MEDFISPLVIHGSFITCLDEKCEISRKRLIVVRNGRKFGTRCNTVHICRVLLTPDSLNLVWGHSVYFAKFPILQFFKLCSSPNFASDSSKLYTRCHNHTGCHFFGGSAKNCKIMAPYAAGIFNFSHNFR